MPQPRSGCEVERRCGFTRLLVSATSRSLSPSSRAPAARRGAAATTHLTVPLAGSLRRTATAFCTLSRRQIND